MVMVGKQVAVEEAAPDFVLTDVEGWTVRLSDYSDTRNVVLVFTRGFL
jgi:peroxiredoxin